MTMPSGPRRALLTLHIAVSVGWIGTVVAYLVLDLTVAASEDVATLRAAWVSMGLITTWALLPLAFASLVSGVTISVGTKWGLFRHWWVVLSLVLTVLAVMVLVSEARYILGAAQVAADAASSDDDVRALQPTLLHSIGGLVVLLVITVLNVYKPRGLTRYGWRKQQESAGPTPD